MTAMAHTKFTVADTLYAPEAVPIDAEFVLVQNETSAQVTFYRLAARSPLPGDRFGRGDLTTMLSLIVWFTDTRGIWAHLDRTEKREFTELATGVVYRVIPEVFGPRTEFVGADGNIRAHYPITCAFRIAPSAPDAKSLQHMLLSSHVNARFPCTNRDTVVVEPCLANAEFLPVGTCFRVVLDQQGSEITKHGTVYLRRVELTPTGSFLTWCVFFDLPVIYNGTPLYAIEEKTGSAYIVSRIPWGDENYWTIERNRSGDKRGEDEYEDGCEYEGGDECGDGDGDEDVYLVAQVEGLRVTQCDLAVDEEDDEDSPSMDYA